MALIERGLNPRNRDVRPRPFINLKWGLLLIGSGTGLLLAYIIDNTILSHYKSNPTHTSFTLGGHHNIQRTKTIIITDSNGVIKKDSTPALKDPEMENNNGDEESHSITEFRSGPEIGNTAIYFALIAIGGGLGLFFSYRIEKKEWIDKFKASGSEAQ